MSHANGEYGPAMSQAEQHIAASLYAYTEADDYIPPGFEAHSTVYREEFGVSYALSCTDEAVQCTAQARKHVDQAQTLLQSVAVETDKETVRASIGNLRELDVAIAGMSRTAWMAAIRSLMALNEPHDGAVDNARSAARAMQAVQEVATSEQVYQLADQITHYASTLGAVVTNAAILRLQKAEQHNGAIQPIYRSLEVWLRGQADQLARDWSAEHTGYRGLRRQYDDVGLALDGALSIERQSQDGLTAQHGIAVRLGRDLQALLAE